MRGVAAVCLGVVASGCQAPESRAPMDLVHAQYLVIAPEDEREYPTSITLEGETRPSLVAPAPAEFRFRLDLLERASLSFALGMTPAPGRDPNALPPGDHARFTVRTGEPIPDTILFEEIVPLTRQGEWLERRVDLAAWSGEEINLVFNATFPSASGDALRPVLAVFAEPVVHDQAHYGKAPGVVIVSIDSLRRDHVSLYGYPPRTTPGLERLAEDAVVFEDAFSPASTSLPSHLSVLTSQRVGGRGGVREAGSHPATLPEIFSDAGYVTQAIVSHRDLSVERGLAAGFRRYRLIDGAGAEDVTDRAIEFLTASGDREFFLFVQYSDARDSYDPPPPYDSIFGRAAQRKVEALYDGEIRYVDKHVERLFREMKRLNIYDPSVIVIFSGHGEALDGSGAPVAEELAIPLAVKFPESGLGGTRSSQSVSLIDVAPTLAGAMDVEIPHTFGGVDLSATARSPAER